MRQGCGAPWAHRLRPIGLGAVGGAKGTHGPREEALKALAAVAGFAAARSLAANVAKH